MGWWKDSAGDVDREFLAAYVGAEDAAEDIAWLFIRQAFASVSRTSIVMMQVTPLPCLLQPWRLLCDSHTNWC